MVINVQTPNRPIVFKNRKSFIKTENHIGYQIRKPIGILDKNRKKMLRKGKFTNCDEHQNRKTDVFWPKNPKTDLENSQTLKPEIPVSFSQRG